MAGCCEGSKADQGAQVLPRAASRQKRWNTATGWSTGTAEMSRARMDKRHHHQSLVVLVESRFGRRSPQSRGAPRPAKFKNPAMQSITSRYSHFRWRIYRIRLRDSQKSFAGRSRRLRCSAPRGRLHSARVPSRATMMNSLATPPSRVENGKMPRSTRTNSWVRIDRWLPKNKRPGPAATRPQPIRAKRGVPWIDSITY